MVFRKKNKEASYFQISKCIKVIVIKTGWHWHKFRYIEQWDREMRNKPTQWINIISQLIFDKDSKNIKRQRIVSLKSSTGENEYLYAKKKRIGSLSYTLHIINSKWTIYFRSEILKLLKTLLNIGLGNDLYDIPPKEQATKSKTNKWNYRQASEIL